MEYEDDTFDWNDERIITLADTTKIINEEYIDSEFLLDVKIFQKHQKENDKMQR